MDKKINTIPEADYYCRLCGAEDSGEIDYSEMTWGSASLVHVDDDPEGYDEYDNYEAQHSDNFEIMAHRCKACRQEGDKDDLFTKNIKEVWTLRYGAPYPDQHDIDKPTVGCECLLCQGGRDIIFARKANKSKTRRSK